MGGAGGFVKNLTAEYMPAYSASTAALHVKVTTAVNTAQRLGTLNPTPQIPDERYSAVSSMNFSPKTRPPWHLIIQVPAAAANPIYLTWDNNTVPVVGGPGLECTPGSTTTFEHAEAMLTPSLAGGASTYIVNALSSIQIIATAATVVLLTYSD
jgi:hypothetical protein